MTCSHKNNELGWRWIPLLFLIEEPYVIHAVNHRSNEDFSSNNDEIRCTHNRRYSCIHPPMRLSELHGFWGGTLCFAADLIVMPGHMVEWQIPNVSGEWRVLVRTLSVTQTFDSRLAEAWQMNELGMNEPGNWGEVRAPLSPSPLDETKTVSRFAALDFPEPEKKK